LQVALPASPVATNVAVDGSVGTRYVLDAGKGLVKIGKSARAPHTRAKQWSMPVLAVKLVADCHGVEKSLHRKFRAHRIGTYEIFSIGKAAALAALECI
jgi:hypothetical protein